MNMWLGGLVIAAVAAGAVLYLTVMRRLAPADGLVHDSNRMGAVFNVLGTAFSVVLAFIILLSLQSYGAAKADAGAEAVAVTALYHDADLFPAPARGDVRGHLVCYARAVVDQEWPAMRHGRASPAVDRWLTQIDATVDSATVTGDKQTARYQQWLQDESARRDGRRGRLAEASPVVPPPLWGVLILAACLVIGYVGLLADRRELLWVQAAMIGAITAITVAGLLTVRFLDDPYQGRSGSIGPTEMRRTLAGIDGQLSGGLRTPLPCDRRGLPAPV